MCNNVSLKQNALQIVVYHTSLININRLMDFPVYLLHLIFAHTSPKGDTAIGGVDFSQPSNISEITSPLLWTLDSSRQTCVSCKPVQPKPFILFVLYYHLIAYKFNTPHRHAFHNPLMTM